MDLTANQNNQKNSLLFILGSRLIGKPLDFDSSITGSYPVSPAKYAGVAQLAEQLTCNQQVADSISVASSIKKNASRFRQCLGK